jgi:hypothetical protein
VQTQTCYQPFQNHKTISQSQCLLEVQPSGCIVHSLSNLLEHSRITSIQDSPDTFHRGVILLPATGGHTRTQAMLQFPTQTTR